ncbi:MAG: hypothetical protein KHY77_10510 [Butyricicoccus pullicaecorum]|nr:hypothetical protein [Butyricicoccus pullicaecorum]
MKTLFKKLISIVLVLTMVFSLSATAFAAEPNSYEELSLTEAEIQAGIERALQIKLSEIDDITERTNTEYGIRENLKNIDLSNVPMTYARRIDLGDIWKDGLPDIHIKNKYVAATIDTILNGILIASGVESLSVALKKFGAKQLQHIFIRTIKKKVIGKAAIALGISLPSIAGFLNYVVDPAGKIAEYFDSKDKKPNNGYLDVIW